MAYNPKNGAVLEIQDRERDLQHFSCIVPLAHVEASAAPPYIAMATKNAFGRLRAYTVRESNKYHLFRDCRHLTHRGMVYPVSEDTLDQIPTGGRVRGTKRQLCTNCRAAFTEFELRS